MKNPLPEPQYTNLHTEIGVFPLRCYQSAASTNDLAKAWAQEGATRGACVMAGQQTAGRGQRGKAFFSPPGGLYMSIILDTPVHAPGLLTTLAAVAAAKAVKEASGQALGIKWVNDLMYAGKKVGGILTESFPVDGHGQRAVIGIGINLGPADFPLQLQQSAGTLFCPEEYAPLAPLPLAKLLVANLLEGLPQVPQHLETYRSLCHTLGQQVSFLWEGQTMTGRAVGITDQGFLQAETALGVVCLMGGELR